MNHAPEGYVAEGPSGLSARTTPPAGPQMRPRRVGMQGMHEV
jgi:hypothetical protein